MKTLLFSTITCLLLGSGILKAQETEPDKLPVEVAKKDFTAKEVGYMAVFPGCERIDVNNKKDLLSCFSNELNELLVKNLEKFSHKMDKQGLTSAVAKLQFVVDKNGKIVQVIAMSGGNQELGLESVKAMNAIAGKIKKIQPAALEDGTPVNLVFQLPVRFVLSYSRLHEFQWTENVIATFLSENRKFEVRQNLQEAVFKIYEVNEDSEIFLGNFKSLSEILAVEPYQSLYHSSKDKFLVAEKQVDGLWYRLYHSTSKPDFIDAYKVNGNEEELLESFPKTHLEYSSLYLKLILR